MFLTKFLFSDHAYAICGKEKVQKERNDEMVKLTFLKRKLLNTLQYQQFPIV